MQQTVTHLQLADVSLLQCAANCIPTCSRMHAAATRAMGDSPKLKMTMSATFKPLDQYPVAPRLAYRLPITTVHTVMDFGNSVGVFMSVRSSVNANWPPTAPTAQKHGKGNDTLQAIQQKPARPLVAGSYLSCNYKCK